MNEIQQILSGIKGGRYGFPAAQRLVADYVVKNYEQIPFLSITALAQNCGVSEKTVVKFCNSLGFEKFTEFKRTFSAYAQSKLIITNKLSSAPAPDGDVFERTMRQDISAIEKTMTLPDNREALSDAARRARSAGAGAAARRRCLFRPAAARPAGRSGHHHLLLPLYRADRGGRGLPACA